MSPDFRNLLRGTVVVACLLVATIVALEVRYRGYETDIDMQFERYDAVKDHVGVLLLGNSHIGAVGDIEILPGLKTFNFAIGGQDLFHMRSILDVAIRESPGLKAVGLSVDPDMLGYSLKVGQQGWMDRQYAPHTGELSDASLTNRVLAQSHFFRSNRDLAFLFAARRPVTQQPGVLRRVTSTDDPEACRRRAVEHSIVKYDASLVPDNLATLRATLELLDRAGARVVVFTPPKRRCYATAYSPEAARTGTTALRGICKAQHLTYLNWLEHPAFDDGDFLDFDHLNSHGAAKLAQFLGKAFRQLPASAAATGTTPSPL